MTTKIANTTKSRIVPSPQIRNRNNASPARHIQYQSSMLLFVSRESKTKKQSTDVSATSLKRKRPTENSENDNFTCSANPKRWIHPESYLSKTIAMTPPTPRDNQTVIGTPITTMSLHMRTPLTPASMQSSNYQFSSIIKSQSSIDMKSDYASNIVENDFNLDQERSSSGKSRTSSHISNSFAEYDTSKSVSCTPPTPSDPIPFLNNASPPTPFLINANSTETPPTPTNFMHIKNTITDSSILTRNKILQKLDDNKRRNSIEEQQSGSSLPGKENMGNSVKCVQQDAVRNTSSNDKSRVLKETNLLSPNRTPNKIKKESKTYEQLYLDLGQKDFAKQTVCPICGMLYVHGVEADTKQHAAICRQYQNGVSFNTSALRNKVANSSSTVRIVDQISPKRLPSNISGKRDKAVQSSTASIVEIRSTDSRQLLKKVDEVKSIVVKELGYVSGSPSDHSLLPQQTAYLCVYNSKIIGMLVVERIQEGYRLLPLSSDKDDIPKCSVTTSRNGITVNRSQVSETAFMGIHLLWVHSQYRKSAIARNLIDTARRKLIYGLVVPVNKIAFSSPTQDGLLFAMKYCNFDSSSSLTPNDNRETKVLVYDCNW